MRLLSCTYFSSFFAASAWAEESSKSNTIPDLANSACETHISIHAPAKGATTGITLLMYFTVFQSSLPRRKRLNRCKDVQKAYGISILAPAKGATTATVRLKRWHRHFNPRSRKGSDLPQKRKRRYIRIFQSTLPRRERQCIRQKQVTSKEFQSTLPRRERRCLPHPAEMFPVFQSTLPRRERPVW